MRSLLIGVLLVFVVAPALGQEFVISADLDERWKLLRGLPGVEVIVEQITPDAERDGLRTSALQTAVELRLRSNGIKVLTRQDRLDTRRKAYLYVAVNTLNDGNGLYGFNVNIRLLETISLYSTPLMVTKGTAWNIPAYTGMVGANNLRRFVQDNVLEKVDQFCNDFLRANPR